VIAVSRRAAILIGLGALYVACWGAGLLPPRPSGQDPARAERRTRPLTRAQVDTDLGDRAYAHVKNLVEFGAREVGSEGWRKGLHYIASEVRRLGLEPVRDRWTDPVENVAFENIAVTLPGERPERIVIGCHHDTKRTHGHRDPARNFHFVGANDSGSGVGLMLALLQTLKDRPRQATLQFVFFDGEESLDWDWNDGARALFGSRRFVRTHRDRLLLGQEPRVVAMVLLDMVGRTDLQIDEEERSTPELREIAWSAAVACGHQARFFRHKWEVKDDHVPFLDAGIPAIDLIDLKFNPHWHKPTDTLEHISPKSLQLVGEVVLTMLPEIEREYLPPRRGTGR
jgi:glutaminyl-peptide cyclotransferase